LQLVVYKTAATLLCNRAIGHNLLLCLFTCSYASTKSFEKKCKNENNF